MSTKEEEETRNQQMVLEERKRREEYELENNTGKVAKSQQFQDYIQRV